MAVASLVLGILSVLSFLTGVFGFLGIIFGIIGIVLGALARKSEPANSVATGGMVTSIVGCALSLIVTIACVGCLAGGMNIFEQASKDPQVKKSLDDFTRELKKLEQKANSEAQKDKTF